ncbi:MAG TPA: dihydroneopterin aldolase [Actinomycetota bacterium]|nr:dihydroneopterin aldolase [Actinomycetota bacterium]
MQRLRLTGIRTEGRHGAREGERDAAQPFLVDLEVDVEAREDDLATTADYRELVELVRAVVARESFSVIETLAQRIAESVAGRPGVLACRAIVHKPLAADRLDAADVAAEAVAQAVEE